MLSFYSVAGATDALEAPHLQPLQNEEPLTQPCPWGLLKAPSPKQESFLPAPFPPCLPCNTVLMKLPRLPSACAWDPRPPKMGRQQGGHARISPTWGSAVTGDAPIDSDMDLGVHKDTRPQEACVACNGTTADN